MRVIDSHVHLTPTCISDRCQLLAKTEPYWQMLSDSPQNEFSTAEEVIEEMDACGIEKSVVFGFSFRDPALCREVNDYTMESVARYPDRLVGFMSLTPKDHRLEEEIDRCKKGGLRGVGEMFPAGQDWDITQRSQTTQLVGLCTERDLPIMVHTNERVGHPYPGKVSTTPFEASKLADHHPETTFIFAHWGGGLFFYELMKEIRRNNRHVYYDTAASIFLYDARIFRVAKELDILDRVLFASDFPLVSPSRYFDYIASSGLDKADLKKIYYQNACRLLSL